jgi:fibronectin type 3 domain-containing protein
MSGPRPTIRFRRDAVRDRHIDRVAFVWVGEHGIAPRGQMAVHGTINGVEFQTVLEPDETSVADEGR